MNDVVPVTDRTRVKRAEGRITADNKGTVGLSAKLPIAHNDKNILSAIGSTSPNGQSYGLALDNIKGHSLSLSESRIPDFGKQQTLAGNLNLMNTDKHNLNANAFVTRNIPKFPEVPNFNTVGGGVDYMFNKKVGASLDVAHTPFLQRTDVNALGKLNLYQNPTTSLDFGAGASRSFSPHIPSSSWEPNFRFSLSKYF
ncbi:attacin protein [Danaus plexippus plexippus]|uniref:Attacin protein n=2 Tax=Danaus plexippus TaxID=13037 RepID=A0A212FNR7_DANPL|nr:attacin protein [Danaus plexippus plexippus]